MVDLDKETLFLSDDYVFYTIEGEGRYVGYPSVFMRLAMCNLTCVGFASPDSPHGCDSFVSWSIKNKLTFRQIFDLIRKDNLHKHLENGAILKLTGGEPLIQQKQLLKFIDAFEDEFNFRPVIDFETNGTLLPDEEWITYNATFTVSPKLRSNGDPEDKTYKPDVLKWHAESGVSDFKFVINDSADLIEIWEKYIDDSIGINFPKSRVWLMPCCGSRKEHIERAPIVAEYAKSLNVNFSPRLQLIIYDKALKV